MKSAILSCLLFSWLAFAIAQDAQPLDDLDKLYLSFTGIPPTPPGRPPANYGTFLAVKFWYMTGNEVPDPKTPTMLYAQASYDPNLDYIQEELFRTAFNGTPLFKYEAPRFNHTYYGAKRAADPVEDWISWYAHLSETQFPKGFAFDTMSGAYIGQFDLRFPAPFKLNIPDSFTIGGARVNYGAEPVIAMVNPPTYGSFTWYPTANSPNLDAVSIGSYGPVLNPTLVNSNWAEDAHTWVATTPGWSVGTHQGLAGFSVCNEEWVEFQGGKKVLFKACATTVKPVTMNVAQPRN